MRCPSSWGALLGLMLGSAAHADALDRAVIAEIIGSERLQMFTYGKLLETGDAPRAAVVQMKQTMAAQGFYYEPGTNPVIATEAWIAPVVSYDGNINGGVLRSSFTFNGLIFEADPAYYAKAGVVLGAAGGGVARVAWANGRYIEARVRAESVWSPEYQIGRSNAELALCSRNHVAGWTFVDLCKTGSALWRELGKSSTQGATIAVSQLFQTDAAYHELTAAVSQTQVYSDKQPSVSVSLGSVWDHAATRVWLTAAPPVAGETVLRSRVATDVQWLWVGHAVGVGLWYQHFDGGAFLGTPRSDNAIGINLSYEINPALTAQIGYMENRSTVDLYDYAQTSVDLVFDALQW